jgi:hypothetical protein
MDGGYERIPFPDALFLAYYRTVYGGLAVETPFRFVVLTWRCAGATVRLRG